MATNRRVLAAAAVTALAAGGLGFGCSKSSSKPSEDAPPGPTSPTTVGTVGVDANPLATAVPDGLAVAAFPSDAVNVQSAQAGTVGVATLTGEDGEVRSEYPTSGLALTDLSSCVGPNQGSGNVKRHEADASGLVTKLGDIVSAGLNPQKPCEVAMGNNPAGGAVTGGFDPNARNAQKKRQEQDDVLNAKASECFSDDVANAIDFTPREKERCYEFDYGLMQGRSCADSAAGDACIVSYSREVVSGGIAKIDGALGLVQGILCQAKKEGINDLPKIGESLDLTTPAAKGSGGKLAIKSAIVKRFPDQNGRPVFRTTVKVERNGTTVEFNLAHSPKSEKENGDYTGTMWIVDPRGASQGPGGNGTSLVGLFSMKYARVNSGKGLDERVKLEVRSANVAKSLVALESTGALKLPTTESLNNNEISAIGYYAFDVNPESSEGSVAFWRNPGGNAREQPRGFVFNLTLDRTSGLLSGCGVAGADRSGVSIRTLPAGQTLKPTGFYTPNICHVNGDNVGDNVWKQCFVQNTVKKVYEVDTAKTKGANGFDWILATAAAAEVPSISITVPTDVADAPVIGAAGPSSPSPGPAGPAMPMPPPMNTPWKQPCTICMQANCTDKPVAAMDRCANGTTHMGDCCGMGCSGGAWGSYKCPTM